MPFEAAPYEIQLEPHKTWQRFRVGTVTGLYYFGPKTIEILAIENSKKNNGHFNDVLQWFMFSCKNNQRDFKFSEVWNQNFKTHLINKQGFIEYSPNNLIKKV